MRALAHKGKFMKPRSSTLFHFTKSEHILFEIFRKGFWPKYCLEDIQWQGEDELTFVAFPMVCFCDIPLARISEHVDFYGSYGLGLTKDWAERNNLNPLLYVSRGSGLNQSITDHMTEIAALEIENKDLHIEHARYLIAHSKPTAGRILVDNKPVEKEFYQESEWRFVPKNENVHAFLRQDQFDDEPTLKDAHENTRSHSSLKFLPSDIAYVFVPKDSDIPNIINFMQTELDHYPSADLKVLFTRVLSIESITRDI